MSIYEIKSVGTGSRLVAASLLTGVAVIALSAAPARAQSQTDRESVTPGSEPSDPASRVIGDIIVIGQKRAVTLAQTPASATVIDRERLEDLHITKLDDIKLLAPSLNLERATGGSVHLNIRGVGNSASGQALEQSVSTYVNGIYAGGIMRETSWPIYDVERVEVYSGTQSGIVGQNTSVGQLQIATARPGTDFGGYIRGGYEFVNNGHSVEGAIDLPVTDSFRLRIAGFHELQGGYIRNVPTGNDLGKTNINSVRLTAVWDVLPSVTFTGFLEYNSMFMLNQYAPVVLDPRGAYADYIRPLFNWRPDDSLAAHYDPLSEQLGHDGDPFVDADGLRGSATFDVSLGGGYNLTSVTAASHVNDELLNDGDFSDAGVPTVSNPRIGSNLYQPSDYDQFTQELRLSSPAENPFSFIVGAWYRHANWTKTTTFLQYNSEISTYRADLYYSQTTDNKSIFGDVQYRFNDRFSIGGSLRATWEDKTAILANPNSTWPVVWTAFPRTELNTDSSFVDYSARIQYNNESGLNLYAAYVKGTKTGGIFDLVANSVFNVFPPEVAKTAEIGVKYSRGGVFASLSAFDLRVDNFHDVVTAVINGNFQFVAQSRSLRHRGMEGQFSVRPVAGLELHGNAFWLPKADDVTLGGRNTRAPRWTLNAGGRYEADLGGDLKGAVFANVSYKTRYFAFPVGNPGRLENFMVRSATLLDVGAELEMRDWTLRLRCSNCTNEYVWAGSVRSTFTGNGGTFGAYTANIPPLRRITLEAGVKF